MITEIISNGFYLDLDKNVPIPINLSISDFREPQSRKRKFSKQVQLPGTVNNMRYFKGMFNLTVAESNVNFDPTAKIKASLIKDGITQLDGNIQLNEVKINSGIISFIVTLYSEAVDLFLLLQNKKVSELGWSDYDHPLTRSNIIDSWTAPKGLGYWYPPIIKDGNKPSILTWRTQDFIPYIYLKEAFLKSMQFAGVSVNSDFINDDENFESIVFGYGGGDLNVVAQSEADDRRVVLEDVTWSQNNLIPEGPTANGVLYQEFVQYDSFMSVNTMTPTVITDPLSQYNNGSFTTINIAHSGNYELSFPWGDLSSTSNISPAYRILKTRPAELLIYRNGTAIASIESEVTDEGIVTGLSTYRFTNSSPAALYLNSGDQLTFSIRFSFEMERDGAANGWDYISWTGSDVGVFLRLTFKDTQISDNDTVVLSRFIPDMTCAELVLNTFRQFNLYMTDQEDGTVTIEPFPDFYQGTNVFDDWSEKVDYSKDIIIKPTANEYGKKVIFKFKETSEDDSNDYFEKYGIRYGDYTLEQGGYYAKGEKVIQLSWGTVIPYEVGFGSNFVNVPRFINVNVSTGQTKTCKPVPRIGINTGLQNGTITVRNTDNTTSTIVNQYGAIHHFNSFNDPTFDLNFKLVSQLYYEANFITTSNCFNLYYFEFINEVINPIGKLLEASIKLNPEDVNKMDFSKLKMIDGALFRLNQVKDFDSDFVSTTKCEFIKVLEARKRFTGKITWTPPVLDDPIIGDPVFEPIDGDNDTSGGVIIGNPVSGISGNIIIG